MYRIVRRESFGPATFLWEVEAPRVARAAQPGHFLMVRVDEHGESPAVRGPVPARSPQERTNLLECLGTSEEPLGSSPEVARRWTCDLPLGLCPV
jgi:hypothetical protein